MFVTHLCFVALAATSALQGSSQQVVRLAGDVRFFAVANDGRRAVFLTDQATAGTQQLYTVRTDGLGTPTRLNDDVQSQVVWHFQVSPDGALVAYRGDRDALGSFQLFVVPSDASAPPLELSHPLGAGGSVVEFEFSPDGTRLVYLARQDANAAVALWGVPADGSAPAVRLDDPPSGTVEFNQNQVTPDGDTVLYFAAIATSPFQALFAAPTDGSAAPLQLAPGTPYDTTALRIGSDSAFVVYRAAPTSGSTLQPLYTAPIDGSSAPVLIANHVVDHQLAPGDARVVYRSPPSYPKLWSAPAHGGLPVELSTTDGFTQYVKDLVRFTPDGARVLYVADQRTTYVFELFTVPSAGGASVRLSRPVGFASVDVRDVLLDATGTRAVYAGRYMPIGEPLPRTELFSVAVAGGPVVRISAQLDGGRGVGFSGVGPPITPTIVIHPRGDEVLYLADQDADEVYELYRTRMDGSTPPRKVNGALVTGGDVQPAFCYARGRTVLYRADAGTDGTFELFAAWSKPLARD